MKTILCYGDSNTYGLNAKTGGRFSRTQRWTGRLQMLLGEEYYLIEEGLSGRTTLLDDPLFDYRNGREYLRPCLESHAPIDLLLLMLGTNDLKRRFSLSALEISLAIEKLIDDSLQSSSGPKAKAPSILLIAPVPIRKIERFRYASEFDGGYEKSHELAQHYQRLAKEKCLHFFNPGTAIELSPIDGIHLSEEGHRSMAQLLAEQLRTILP